MTEPLYDFKGKVIIAKKIMLFVSYYCAILTNNTVEAIHSGSHKALPVTA